MFSNATTLVQIAYAQVVYDGTEETRQHIERVAPGALGDVAIQKPRRRVHRLWSREEDEWLDQHLGKLSIREIGRFLGRTPAAIKIRHTRLGLVAPSKRDLTARDVEQLTGVDAHSVVKWIKRGYLKAQPLPAEHHIWRIRWWDLVRFLAEPDNWAYFCTDKIRDSKLRAFVQRAQTRYSELADYLTPSEAAKVAGICVHTLNRLIREGRIPAKRWGNWWVLCRDIEIYRQRSIVGLDRWPTPRSDAFLMQAKEWDWSYAQIASAMKHPTISQVRYRAQCLRSL